MAKGMKAACWTVIAVVVLAAACVGGPTEPLPDRIIVCDTAADSTQANDSTLVCKQYRRRMP